MNERSRQLNKQNGLDQKSNEDYLRDLSHTRQNLQQDIVWL